MKRHLFLLAFISLLAASCSKNNDSATTLPSNKNPIIYADIYGTWEGTLTFTLPDGTSQTSSKFQILVSPTSNKSQISIKIGASKEQIATLSGNGFSASYAGQIYIYEGTITLNGLFAENKNLSFSNSRIFNTYDKKTYSFTGSFVKIAVLPS